MMTRHFETSPQIITNNICAMIFLPSSAEAMLLFGKLIVTLYAFA